MIHGKIVLQGTLELLSPTLIGSGNKDISDIDLLLDDNGKPFIPATSLVGVLRQAIRGEDDKQNERKHFWGFTREDKVSEDELEHESVLRCSDLHCQNQAHILLRDGIRIDNKTGLTEDQGKYDYQVIDRGAKFRLNLEASYSNATQQFVTRMMVTIAERLEKSEVQIGAKTNNGLGQITLRNKAFFQFDFTKKQDIWRWLTWAKDPGRTQPVTFSKAEYPPFPGQNRTFLIDATLDLKTSLIVRSYATSPDQPDAVNVESGGSPVLPGSSLKGAIRARAERILKTLGTSNQQTRDMLCDLFGYVDDKKRSTQAKRGRVRVEEVRLNKCLAELHHRIRIDRFTGGTVETALFETMPVFTDFNAKVRNVRISIQNYKPYEPGLMLLVFKDLWAGDLPVGGEKNIGRGVFQGCWAEITCSEHEQPIRLEKNFAQISEENQNSLETFISDFHTYHRNKNQRVETGR